MCAIWQKDGVPSGVVSLSEGKLESLTKKGTDLNMASTIMKAHQFSFTRCYPAGHRVDSSNYIPMADWALGAQVRIANP